MNYDYDGGKKGELKDTGADISVLPFQTVKGKSTPSNFKVFAANGTPIDTFGTRNVTIDLGLRHPFAWEFLLARVKQPIIGADFLKRYGFLVDLRNRRLIDGLTNLRTTGLTVHSTEPTLTTVDSTNRYSALLKEFIDVTRTVQKRDNPTHQVRDYITTKGTPVAGKARRLPSEKHPSFQNRKAALRQQEPK
nr:PREDICTED: uncharacterized protein LOC105663867 [Megachile rotundata]